jgi:hypothetical protein
MAQIEKVRLPDGRSVRPTEWTSTPYWSTVEFAATQAGTQSAFSYGLGGTVPGSVGPRRAFLPDTNLRGDGGIIQENAELLLFALQVELWMRVVTAEDYATNNIAGTPPVPFVSAQNILAFQRDVILRLRIANEKPFIQHPVGFFPAGVGVEATLGAANGVDGNPVIAADNGRARASAIRNIATPHRIMPGETWGVDFDIAPPTGLILDFGDDTEARLVARTYAVGYRKRPVV